MNTENKAIKTLLITARYGGRGHEEHYILKCWGSDELFAPPIDCPTELGLTIEELLKNQDFWFFSNRGDRIEIHHQDSNKKFVSDHVTLRRVLLQACKDVSNDIAIPPFKIRVSHADYRPNWYEDMKPEGFDLSTKFMELKTDSMNFIEKWPALLRSLRSEPVLFLRIDFRDIACDAFRARFLKGFLEDNISKPWDREQKRIAVLLCSEKERIEHNGVFDNLICSGVKWQERIE